MSFTLTCSKCGSSRRVADDIAGKRVRCPDCRAVFRAESPKVDIIDDESAEEPRSRRDRDDGRPRGKPSRGKAGTKKARKKHGAGYFVGLAAALLLAAGAVTFVAWKAGAFGKANDGRVKLDANG